MPLAPISFRSSRSRTGILPAVPLAIFMTASACVEEHDAALGGMVMDDAPMVSNAEDLDTWRPTPLAGAPETRWPSWPSSVWTGSEMVVWTDGEGARYSPEDDRWRPLPYLSELQSREKVSMVWTGDAVIVWGGTDPGLERVDTGALYSPAEHSWAPMSREGAPSPRSTHAAVWTGDAMIVWGGFGPDPDRSSEDDPPIDLATGGIYDPLADRWTAMTNSGAPAPCQDPLVVWTGEELIVIVREDGARYDPAEDRWDPISTQGRPDLTPIYRHRAVWTGSEVLVGLLAAYDPSTDRWRELAGNGSARRREGYSLVWTGWQAILWGGADAQYDYQNTGFIYDPETGDWHDTPTAFAPSARVDHTAVWTGDEMIVWGGDVTYAFDDPEHETEAFNDGARLTQ